GAVTVGDEAQAGYREVLTMSMNLFRPINALIVLLLVVPLAATPATDAPVSMAATNPNPVRIGVTTSLTGPLANFGALQKSGMQMWGDDINERGALVGRPVQLVVYDDGSSAEQVTKLYEQLITRDNVDFLISPYSSNLTLAAAAVAERHGVPMVTVA